MIRGRVHAIDLAAIETDHPVDWLRGCRTIGVASRDISGATIGTDVVVLSEDEFGDVQMLARLARGSSWPGDMAHRVEVAATRILGGES